MPVPNIPSGINLAYNNGVVAAVWPQNTAGAAPTSYTLYRSTTTGAGFSAVTNGATPNPFTASGTNYFYQDNTVTNGIPYYYRVTASNGSGESSPTTQAVATPQATTDGATFSGQSNILTSVQPNQVFTANLKFINTGGSAWIESNYYYLEEAGTPGGTQWGISQIGNGSSGVGQVIFTAAFTAPGSAGTYPFQWQMYQEYALNAEFGAPSTLVNINVVGNPQQALPAINQPIYHRGDTQFGDWQVLSPGTPLTSANPRGLVVLTAGTLVLKSQEGHVVSMGTVSQNSFLDVMPTEQLGGTATVAALW